MTGRIFKLIVLGVLATARLNGQVSVGVVGGLVSSSWSLSTGCQTCEHSLTGLATGAAINVPMGSKFSFAPEVLFERMGSGLDYPGSTRIEYRLGYVEVPVLLRYAVRTSGAIRPFIVAGAQFGLTVSCSSKTINSAENGGEVFVEPCTTGLAGISQDQPNPVDFGAMAGAGASFGRFSATVRYDHGLTNIYSRYSGNGAVHNTAWLVLLAARL